MIVSCDLIWIELNCLILIDLTLCLINVPMKINRAKTTHCFVLFIAVVCIYCKSIFTYIYIHFFFRARKNKDRHVKTRLIVVHTLIFRSVPFGFFIYFLFTLQQQNLLLVLLLLLLVLTLVLPMQPPILLLRLQLHLL